jgi:V-type H+-transporting ATPase subunit a
MKIAVILGVMHMSLGIVLKGINALYRKDYLEIYFEFIP